MRQMLHKAIHYSSTKHHSQGHKEACGATSLTVQHAYGVRGGKQHKQWRVVASFEHGHAAFGTHALLLIQQ
jgi:hypothetical protein